MPGIYLHALGHEWVFSVCVVHCVTGLLPPQSTALTEITS